MTTKWRNNKETFMNRNTPDSGVENFANIPLFDILKNSAQDQPTQEQDQPTQVQQMDNKPKKRIIEGLDFNNMVNGSDTFNMFLDDYFIGCTRYIRFMQANGFGFIFQSIFKYTFNPIYELDKAFENILYALFITLLQPDKQPCINDTPPTPTKSSPPGETNPPDNDFIWTNTTSINNTKIEGFGEYNNANMRKTLQSFVRNHAWIDDMNIEYAVGNFYIDQVNKYQTRLHRPATPEELIIFNNRFDDSLNKPEIKAYILKKIKVPKYKTESKNDADSEFSADTNENWSNFISGKARFMIYNKSNITYFPFNDKCFPIPKNMEKFNAIVASQGLEEYTDGFTEYKNELNKLSAVDVSQNKFGLYTITANIHGPVVRKDTIQNYLVNTVRNLTYLCLETDATNSTIKELKMTNKIPLYKARIATLYVKIINYVEYQLYRLFKLRLNACELAVINAAFYGLILKNQLSDNTGKQYNSADYLSKNINKLAGYIIEELSKMIPSDTIQNGMNAGKTCTLVKNKVTNEYVMNTVFKNYVETSKKNGSNQYDTFLKSIGQTSDNNKNEDVITTNPYDNNKYNVNIAKYVLEGTEGIQPDIQRFFLSKQLIDCDMKTKKTKEECKHYAAILKSELYKIMVIPLCIYVAYNFYYTFFFKDCASPTKTFDDDGNPIYKNECDECFNPIFPDWEGYFRYFDEKHTTDYFCEFLFKPVKFIYTVLNSLKALFRKNISIFGTNIILKEQMPYLFFLLTVYAVYYAFWTNYSTVYEYIGKMINMENPIASKLESLFTNFAKLITIFAFALSALKNISGLDILESIRGVFRKLDKESMPPETETDTKPETWIKWIYNSVGPLFALLKFIWMLIYWGLKGYITYYIMLPFAIFICSIYVIWNLLFTLYNNTTEGVTISDKIELMQRVMYSKLYIDSKEPKFNIKTIVKYIFWFILFFLFELSACFILLTSMKTFSQTIRSPQIKTGLVLLYLFLLAILGLWTFYKYWKKVPVMNSEYVEPRPSPDMGVNKRIEIVKNSDIENNIENICKDYYERQTANKVAMVFLNSDYINYKLINDYMKKRSETKKEDNKTAKSGGWTNYLSKMTGKMIDAAKYVINPQQKALELAIANQQLQRQGQGQGQGQGPPVVIQGQVIN